MDNLPHEPCDLCPHWKQRPKGVGAALISYAHNWPLGALIVILASLAMGQLGYWPTRNTIDIKQTEKNVNGVNERLDKIEKTLEQQEKAREERKKALEDKKP